MALDVSATLTYLSDLPIYQNEKLYELWVSEPPADIPQTNSEFTEVHGISIHDARQLTDRCSLDSTGFAWITHMSNFLLNGEELLKGDQPEKLKAYLEECMDLVKERLEAEHVVCFDWRVSGPGYEAALSEARLTVFI